MSGDRVRATPLLEESVEIFTTVYGRDNPRAVEARLRRDRYLGGQ